MSIAGHELCGSDRFFLLLSWLLSAGRRHRHSFSRFWREHLRGARIAILSRHSACCNLSRSGAGPTLSDTDLCKYNVQLVAIATFCWGSLFAGFIDGWMNGWMDAQRIMESVRFLVYYKPRLTPFVCFIYHQQQS